MAIKTMEFVRKIRDEHYRILKDKPVSEQIAFYQQQAKLVRARAVSFLKKQASHLWVDGIKTKHLPNALQAQVTREWIVEKGESAPRLITAHPV